MRTRKARIHPHTQKYIVPIAFPRQHWFHGGASMVRYMDIASLTNFNVNHDSPFSVVPTLWTGLSRNRGKISVTSEVFLFFNVRSGRRVQHTHTVFKAVLPHYSPTVVQLLRRFLLSDCSAHSGCLCSQSIPHLMFFTLHKFCYYA